MAKLLSGKTFVINWYANDHSREILSSCQTQSCHVLHETYRITYSIKIQQKIFTIECKITKNVKVFPLESFVVYDTHSNGTFNIYCKNSA